METVLITGGSGLIGTELTNLLLGKGYKVRHLSRSAKTIAGVEVYIWDVDQMQIDDRAVEGVDYIIHLAGAGIADKYWTLKRRQQIIDSRIASAKLLLESIRRTDTKPKALISTSAIGLYGNRNKQELTETSEEGSGFLSKVCHQWEAAVLPAKELGIRLAIIRVGIVLSGNGGALVEMGKSIPFHIAGYLGDGSQYYSWIHIKDICGIFLHAITHEIEGVYNGVAPNPVTNKELTLQIARTRNITALPLPAPAFALRLAMGEMADMILDSAKVSSHKIEAAGYQFQFPEVDQALQDIYKK